MSSNPPARMSAALQTGDTAIAPVPDVGALFRPYDGSGNLYYRVPPEDN